MVVNFREFVSDINNCCFSLYRKEVLGVIWKIEVFGL